MFCKHKYGKVENGYQHCEKCGKAIAAPEKICGHEWVSIKILNNHPIERPSNITSIVYHDRCEHCGELKRTELN